MEAMGQSQMPPLSLSGGAAEKHASEPAAGKQSWGSKLAEGRTKKATDGQSQRWKTRGARDSKPKGAPQHPLKEPIPAKEKGEKFFSNLRKKLAQQAKMFSNVRRQKDSGL